MNDFQKINETGTGLTIAEATAAGISEAFGLTALAWAKISQSTLHRDTFGGSFWLIRKKAASWDHADLNAPQIWTCTQMNHA